MKITVTHQNVKVEIVDEHTSSMIGADVFTNRVCQLLHEIAHQIRFINEKQPLTGKDLNWTKLYEQRK